MDVKNDDYRVWFDTENETVWFAGSMRFGSAVDTQPIENLLHDVLDAELKTITLDLRELSFLNSTGINMLYKFAIATRKKGNPQLVVRGSNNNPWQGKSLPNLKRFTPNFELILVD